MKKFLTVLLVVSVLFTFSFGSAFAAEAVTPSVTKTHDEAMVEAKAEALKDITTAATNAKTALSATYKDVYWGSARDLTATIAGSVYAATIDEMAANAAKAVEKAFATVDTTYPTEATVATLKGYLLNTQVDLNVEYDETVQLPARSASEHMSVMTQATGTPGSEWTKYYAVYTYTNALADLKAYVNGEIAKIDLSVYTNDVMDKTAAYPQTYAEKAAEIVAELQKAVADTTVGMTKSFEEAQDAIWAMFNKVDTAIAVKDTVEYIDNTVIVVSYKLTDASLKTAEQLAAEGVMTDANKATLKAQVQSTVAGWTQWALSAYQNELAAATTAAQREAAKATYEARLALYADYAAVNNVLIEEGKALVADEYTAAARVDAYEAAAKVAAIVKIEVEKDGSLKYDAAEVDKILAKLQVKIYAGEQTAAVTAADFAGALVKSSTLEWDKAHAACDVKDAMEDVLYDAHGAALYYADAQAKIEAAFQKKIDKIEAAATAKQLEEAKKMVVTYSVLTKEQVKANVAGYANTNKFIDAVNHYVGYLNYTANADGQRSTVAYADAAVAKYLAEAGARTNADVAKFMADAETYAKGLQTVGEARAERVAVSEAIKALPNVVTLADKEAVKAAWEMAVEAGYMTDAAKLVAAKSAVQTAELKAINDAVKALPAKLTAADDAAVEAIYDAIEAYEEEKMYGYPAYDETKVDAAAAAVKAAWLADVHTAIAAATASAPASVEAAREAADAYVARYTSVCADVKAVNDIVNMDKLTFMEAEVAAAKIEAVEALKITAGSTAKKGAITVKWTVKGDTSAVEGYEIWKSTKKNSGFKKAFTTTKMSYKNTKGLKKGTKYFYKVRAIAYVGAEKITSDWSNKAYRVAK